MRTPSALVLILLLIGLWPVPSRADPGYYLITPYERAGETDVSFHYWTVEPKQQSKMVWPEIGLGYGVTKRWYTKVYASGIGPGLNSTSLDTLNWQNDYLLTQGQYPFDLAVHTNLVLNRDHANGKAFEFGPVLQTDVGRVQVNTNLVFSRPFQQERPTATQLRYQWQLKYRWQPKLQFGLQGFGELGTWDHWASADRQSHRAGPLLAGTWVLGPRRELRYQVAWLSGKTYGQSGSMLSARLQYVF